MCNSCSPGLTPDPSNGFADRLLDIVNHAGLAMMLSVGHRTGLFDAMATLDEASSQQIAEAAGLEERYVRECLGALVTGEIVEFDPATTTYSLPEAHANLLTRNSAENFASTMQWISVLGEVESKIVNCFKSGGGVPYSSFSRFHEVMAEESGNTVVAGLTDHILPLCVGLREQLEQGIDVLDVGCGRGRAMIYLAKEFPNSRFAGYDLGPDAIAWATAEANRQGAKNVQFEVKDVMELGKSNSFDLITAFDSIHDQAHPSVVLSEIANALRSNGLFLMQDIQASSHVDKNVGAPLAPFLYTISCMHCMTVSLAQDGVGLGAVWGKELACDMLRDAGFTNVQVETLEHDIINYYYLAKAV